MTWKRAVPLLLASALALGGPGCTGSRSARLSYAQVQALNPGVDADWVLAEFPGGQVSRDPQGRVRSVRYRVTDPAGRAQTLVLAFDESGVLRCKTYSGRPMRPRGGP